MFNKHLISAASSLSLTLALFTGIEAYAANLARTPLQGSTQTAPQAGFQNELSQALENERRELKDNMLAQTLAQLPEFAIEAQQRQVAQR
ncbi:hypothetical protein SAMN04488038_10182 [Solimonas aquatica]|uniref:Uncharacterized protein n=1 Tax=Solimonas aquatica TaxID=489703 RepID=A0A1H8ZLE9_9GAMM|nr:hypothetical protein [Solimonas aquatica]SEP65107.1 hypothetical protein SAMN04488038_10182 [Solimonas aquatica]